jgi:hypothetical protein
VKGYQVKDIPGYEGRFSVDSEGEVFSHNFRGSGTTKKLKAMLNKGDLKVSMYKDGKSRLFSIHKLMQSAFGLDKGRVTHINGDRTDNRLANLSTYVKGCTLVKNKHKPDKWIAFLHIGSVLKYLGGFLTEQEAHEAHMKARALRDARHKKEK